MKNNYANSSLAEKKAFLMNGLFMKYPFLKRISQKKKLRKF
jgi:hypothetical protein